MHFKYPTINLTIIMLIILFHIKKCVHSLVKVCGVLRPLILVIDYNQ